MMMDLARHYGEGARSLSDIARDESLPLAYLEQLVGRLRKAQLVLSRHGSHGGYELSRRPVDISVGEVMRILEGPISPMICATEGETVQPCERHPICGANLVWERVRDSVAQALDSLTLADLVPRDGDSRQLHDKDTIYLQPVTRSGSEGRNAPRL